MKFPSLIRLVIFLLLPCLLPFAGCARMSVWQKSGVIVGTAGAAGAVILTSNYASAGASVAGSVGAAVLGGSAAMVIDAVEATPEQINAVEESGKRYMDALDASKAGKYLEKGRSLIAISVKQNSKSRGQGSVMLYDTKKRKVRSKKVYELRTLPKVGEDFVFETEQAEYIGVVPMFREKAASKMATLPPVNPVASQAAP